MPYKSLGRCGLKVSVFSLGGWTTFGGSVKDPQVIKKILSSAFHSGINYFDSADIYEKGENEIVMGNALCDFPRNELVLSSKVFWPMSDDINNKGLSRKHIFESIHSSLKRFKTDYLDLYFCHRYDEETPLEETVRAMSDLVQQGKILYWGTSEWTAEQIRSAHEICTHGGYHKPQVEQPQYSLLVRKTVEKSIIPTAQEFGMGLVVWSPLASGLLTGKYDNGVQSGRLSKIEWLKERLYTHENIEKVKKMKFISDDLGITRTQLALAWAAGNPAISSVILGATSLEQLNENLKALSVQVSTQERKELESIF